VSSDPTSITTERSSSRTAELPAVPAAGPITPSGPEVAGVGAGAPGAGSTAAAGTGAANAPAASAEPCPHCGAQLALDQRYCLECGVPRTYLSGMLLARLRMPAEQASQASPGGPPTPPGQAPRDSGAPPAWSRASVLTLIAGVGVLLLAMGVGVLIGRSGGSSASGSAAPQVLTVPQATSTPSTQATPPTTTTPEASSKGGSHSKGGSKKGASSEGGSGSTPSKPAPPSVVQNLRKGGSGQSFEQKSKNRPNVISTG
jgi:hypothetical protein